MSDKLLRFEIGALEMRLGSKVEAEFESVKIRGEVGEISESILRVRPRTKPFIYF